AAVLRGSLMMTLVLVTQGCCAGCYVADNFGHNVLGGAGIGVVPSPPAHSSIEVLLLNTVLHNNSLNEDVFTLAYGAGLFTMGTDFYTHVRIEGGTFSNNTCIGHGGALFPWTKTEMIVEGVVISNNNANHDGGGLSVDGDVRVQISNSQIFENRAFRGGGLAVNGVYSTDTNGYHRVEMRGCHLLRNWAEDSGGGLVTGSYILVVEDLIIAQNSAGRSGAGIRSDFSIINITRCVFSENTCLDGAGLNVYGDLAILQLTHSVFGPYNLADGDGGGLHASADVKARFSLRPCETALWGFKESLR
ncbi:hypothetical protein CYMTET_30053, partial [Cymbomonas tetramitiformis]